MLTQQFRRVQENIPIPKARSSECLLGDIIEDFVVEWRRLEVRYAYQNQSLCSRGVDECDA